MKIVYTFLAILTFCFVFLFSQTPDSSVANDTAQSYELNLRDSARKFQDSVMKLKITVEKKLKIYKIRGKRMDSTMNALVDTLRCL